jgi:PIN domain nuclease of toxin-antitoxin system
VRRGRGRRLCRITRGPAARPGLLIAQAIIEGMTLVSNERSFDAYGVARLW